MKVLVLLSLLALASARVIDNEFATIGFLGFMERYAIPLAEKIRLAEEADEESRIVGGSPSASGQFPYQAAILVRTPAGTGICGASLINSRRVVTAAHCWNDNQSQGNEIEVVLGSTRLWSGGTRLNAGRNIVVHPNWFPLLVRNDVAFIRLPTDVSFSGTIAPIALPSGSEINDQFVGRTAVASGFGQTGDNVGIGANQFLSHVSVPVITNSECAQTFPLQVQPTNICTSTAAGTGTCQGDSGGPLAVESGGRPILIGITSFGARAGCAVGFPSVFARVSSYVTFFNQN